MTSFLGWLVIVIPTILGVLLVFMPDSAKNAMMHRRWKYGLLLAAIAYSSVVWWWQVRSDREAVAKSQEDIARTSKVVAEETTRNVTKSLGDQYQAVIASLTGQIGELKGQLAAQGKDVGTIKRSDIVTGKKPIRVEVTNPSIAQHPTQSQALPSLPNLSWTQERRPRNSDGKVMTVVKFRVDNYLMLPGFVAVCDKACETVSGECEGISQPQYLNAGQISNIAGIFFNVPRPLPPAVQCSMEIASRDDSQVRVNVFRIIRESELPPDLR